MGLDEGAVVKMGFHPSSRYLGETVLSLLTEGWRAGDWYTNTDDVIDVDDQDSMVGPEMCGMLPSFRMEVLPQLCHWGGIMPRGSSGRKF